MVSRTALEGPFNLKAGESIPYEFGIRFLKQGTFQIQPSAVIQELGGNAITIDASSPQCQACDARATTVLVEGVLQPDGFSATTTALVVAAVVIIGGGASVAYYYHKRRKSSRIGLT